jgi:nitrate reductase gamma subunit
MNFGLVILALMLTAGAMFGIFSIAQANQTNYVDTFGTTTSVSTNQTHDLLMNSTAPAMALPTGIAFLLAVTFLFVCAVFVARSVSKQNRYQGRG